MKISLKQKKYLRSFEQKRPEPEDLFEEQEFPFTSSRPRNISIVDYPYMFQQISWKFIPGVFLVPLFLFIVKS